MAGVTPLHQLAARLGLSNPALTSKADEYERLLKLKMHGVNRISDSAQAIICLDFATTLFNEPFDSESALKLAAIRRPVYVNYKHTVGKLLGIDNVINVNSLCVQLGCTNLCEIATEIFTYYKQNAVENCDWEHPQFACMAVYQACKLKSVKISKNKFINNSRLKLSQWNELEGKWSKVILQVPKFQPKIKIRNKDATTKKNSCKEDLGVCEKSEIVPIKEEELESYEMWKNRILEETFIKVKLNKESISDLVNMDKNEIRKIIEKYLI